MRIAILLLSTVAAALAQAPAAPAFEVASVRAGQPGRESIETGPASLTMQHIRLKGSIRWAYGVQDVQVSGPAWLNDVWFDIFAKAPQAVTVEQLRGMLRTLLADRFKLAIHREQQEMGALVIVVAKSGHKLEPVEQEGSPSFTQDKLSLTGRGAELGQLFDFIANELHVPVVNQTGLTGRFNYFFDIDPYYTEASRSLAGADGKPPDANNIIAVAMQKELGLKVEEKKVQVEVIVVDHAERTPTAN
jgi:uncharacterized protein (TIGR03435 family)